MKKEIKINYRDYMEIYLFKSSYSNNGNLAIVAICDDGEVFGMLTVNLCDLPKKNLAYLDTSNMPDIEEALVKNGIAKKIGKPRMSGFYEYELFEFIDVDNIPNYM